MLKGYVYILSNPKMPGLLKIGCTTREVDERVEELNSAAGVPTPFTVEAYFSSPEPEKHESEIHARLGGRRIKGREFFEVGLIEVVQIAAAVVGADPIYQRDATAKGTSYAAVKIADSGSIWTCGLCKHEWTVIHRKVLSGCPLCGSGAIVCLRYLTGRP